MHLGLPLKLNWELKKQQDQLAGRQLSTAPSQLKQDGKNPNPTATQGPEIQGKFTKARLFFKEQSPFCCLRRCHTRVVGASDVVVIFVTTLQCCWGVMVLHSQWCLVNWGEQLGQAWEGLNSVLSKSHFKQLTCYFSIQGNHNHVPAFLNRHLV